MDELAPTDFDAIDDIHELRAILRDTTAQLQTAAQMGLSLATQNHSLQQRLESFEHEKDELHQRLTLVERDRRRMQDQSLLVDQLRETLADLQSRYSGRRQQQRVSVDVRIDRVEQSIDGVREELDSMQVVMADIDEARWRNERQQLTKAMQGVRDDVEAAECRIGDVQAKVAGNEQRQATMHAEVAKRFADLQRQIDVLAEMGVRCQDQIGWTAQAQVSIEHEMRVAVAECNEMLGGHEAVIRALRDGGSPTRYQPLQTLFDQLPQEHEQLQQKRESRGDSGVSPSLHHDNNNHSGGMAARGESLDDIFAHDAGLQPALGLYHHHQPAPSATLHHNDSASHQADAAALVSSSTATATTAASGFPSPPMSASGEPELSPLAEFVAKASTLPRKAASVIGTNLRRPTRRAVSTHVCRRSASDDEQQQQRHQSLQPLPPMSPTRPAALDGLISRAAHVGVGWGNYWQARQHKLEIDIQKRLGVPANAIRATSDDVVVD